MNLKNAIRSILDICLFIVGLVGVFFAVFASKQVVDFVKYFTLLSNIVGAGICLFDFILVISKKETAISKPFRYLSTISLFCVFLVNLILLEPIRNTPITFYEIILHYVVPLLTLVTYFVFDIDKELKFRFSFLPIIFLLIYGSYSIPLVSCGVWNDFYGFLDLGNNSKLLQNLLILVIIVLTTYLFSLILWLANRLISGHLSPSHDKIIKEDINKVEQTNVVEFENINLKESEIHMAKEEKKVVKKTAKKVEEKPVKKPVTKATPKKVEAKKEPAKKIEPKKAIKIETVNDDEEADDSPVSYRIYHISKRKDDGKWQVKFAKGQKAIKLFKTQLEAIEYAKVLAENQGGSIRIHSLKGKIRK